MKLKKKIIIYIGIFYLFLFLGSTNPSFNFVIKNKLGSSNFTFQELGWYDDGGTPADIFVDGTYAYIADNADGLEIIDMTGAYISFPYEIGQFHDGGWPVDVYVSGSYAYVADYDDGLEIINIANPAAPYEAGQFHDGGSGNSDGVFVSGSYAYVADMQDGLEIINVTDPTTPTEIGSYDDGGFARGVFVSGSYAYIADWTQGLEIINITNPAAPYRLGRYYETNKYAENVFVMGSYAYVTANGALQIIDISNPAAPTKVGEYSNLDGGGARNVFVHGSYAYLADTTDGLEVIDVSDPTSPEQVGQFNDGGSTVGVFVLPFFGYTHAYVADRDDGLEILRRNSHEISWTSPTNGEEVIFGEDTTTFNFSYSYENIDDAILVINGINYGSVWGLSQIELSFTEAIQGNVNAVLRGYKDGYLVTDDSRNFYFSKIQSQVITRLERNTTNIGKQLYLILHDPNGDNSFSGYTQTSSLEFSFGMELRTSLSVSLEFGDFFDFHGTEVGASEKISLKSEAALGYDFTYEVTDTSSIFSNLESNNPDYIGPGNGDRYWGEGMVILWELNAAEITYYNGTTQYKSPKWNYGILRSAEVFWNDENAPADWRAMNPVHNNYENVTWLGTHDYDGGSPYPFSHSVSTSSTVSRSVSIEFGYESTEKIPGLTKEVEFELEFEVHGSSTHSYEVENSYEMYDDEPEDEISYDYGIDNRFKTFIFKTNTQFSETSAPFEYETTDVHAPDIDFPMVNLDSNQDGLYPCVDDSPVVLVDIEEEDQIQTARISYSIDAGTIWNHVDLTEQPANPGTWYASLPPQQHGTTVKWFVKAWDVQGNYAERKDEYGDPYLYTIINRNPTITVIKPNGREEIDNLVEIEWIATDADGDNLTYTIAYNIRNEGWHVIATGLTGSTYFWNVTEFDYVDSVLIQIKADDGWNGTAVDESDYSFSIQAQYKGLSTGAIIGISTGSVGVIGAVATVTAIMVKKKRKRMG